MNFFKRILSKENHELSEEEKLKLNSILSDKTQSKEQEFENKISQQDFEKSYTKSKFDDFVDKLSREDISEIRLLLDKRESQIDVKDNVSLSEKKRDNFDSNFEDSSTKNQDVDTSNQDNSGEFIETDSKEEKDETLENKEKENQVNFELEEVDDIHNIEIKKKEDISKVIEETDEMNFESYDDENSNHNYNTNQDLIDNENSNEEYVDINQVNQKKSDEIVIEQDDEIKEDFLEEEFENIEKEKSILEKVKDIFGSENVFEKKDTKSKYDIINGKNIQFIGIRKLKAFENNESTLDQNAWFITNIKKLVELKQFKMLESNPTLKELVLEDEINPILLCYKSTQLLSNQDQFEFN